MNQIIRKLGALAAAGAMMLQMTACSGTSSKDELKQYMLDLESAVRSMNSVKIISLTDMDKDSTYAQELGHELSSDRFDDETTRCHKAVADKIKLDYSDNGIKMNGANATCDVTFEVPKWKEIYRNDSLDTADKIESALAASTTDSVSVTLEYRYSKPLDKWVLINPEAISGILDFAQYDIPQLVDGGSSSSPDASSPDASAPDSTAPDASSPDASAPGASVPDASSQAPDSTSAAPSESGSTPSESGSGASASEPATSPNESEQGGNSGESAPAGKMPDKATIYKAYAEIIKKNSENIEWYEKKVNKNSCGIIDIDGDGVDEMYFFSQTVSSKVGDYDYASFSLYAFNPTTGKPKKVMSSPIALGVGEAAPEAAVFYIEGGNIVYYTGYIDKEFKMTDYTIYNYKRGDEYGTYNGFMTCSDFDFTELPGGEHTYNCKINKWDKYDSNTNVTIDEFRRVESELLASCKSVLGSNVSKKSESSLGKSFADKSVGGMSMAKALSKLG